MEQMKKCGNCKHSHELPLQKQRQCRLNSPDVFPIPSRVGGLELLSSWPSVQATDWCSKFEPDFSKEVEQ